jgi:hypothetical protein
VEQLGGRGLFDDVAMLHNCNVVCNLAYHSEIVRDEEHREGVSPAQFTEEGDDLGLDGDVERGGGLVGDQELRTIDECHGDEDALALASRELVREVAEAALRVWERDLVHGGDDAGSDDVAGKLRMVRQESFGNLVPDPHDGV